MNNNSMFFSDLDQRLVRERINVSQLWESWIEAEHLRRHSFTGSMGFESRGGKDYLYRRIGKSGKSLGPRSIETEAQLERFRIGREENKTRLDTLADNLDKEAAILRGLKDGRMPVIAASILRQLRIHGRKTGIRVVGTNALYAYEALAGVKFEESATATADIDLLQDDRRTLHLLSEDRRMTGLTQMIQNQVDKSFAPAAHGTSA